MILFQMSSNKVCTFTKKTQTKITDSYNQFDDLDLNASQYEKYSKADNFDIIAGNIASVFLYNY